MSDNIKKDLDLNKVRELIDEAVKPYQEKIDKLKKETVSTTETAFKQIDLISKTQEVKDIFKKLNGKSNRFNEVMTLGKIDLSKDIKEVKETLVKTLEKYPEFRKPAEGSFKQENKNTNNKTMPVAYDEEKGIDFVVAARKMGI